MSTFKKESVKRPVFQVNGLRVDDLQEPLGVDHNQIRFSWRLQSKDRGVESRSSRIWIATDQRLLERGQADVWDSGKLMNRNLYAEYTGPRLKGASRYWWKAAVWDKSGNRAESEPAFFDTGLYPENWKARWIWSSRRVRTNDYAYLRKEIRVKKPVAFAKLFMSAHNTAHVFINGKRVGGYGSPAPTNPLKRKYYLAYDVSALLEAGAGPCCISAIVHYLGGSGQNYVNGLPGFRLQLEVTYEDGAMQSWKTDTTWEALKEIPRPSGMPYQQNRRISAMEDYDAGKHTPDWQLPGLNKASSKRAVMARIAETEWPMKWQEIPEGTIDEVIVPKDITPAVAGAGRQVFDTGRIVSGWPRLRLAGIPDITVLTRYSEDLDENGFVKHNVCNEIQDRYYDRYRTRGERTEIWEPDLSFKAFRYVEAEGYPDTLIAGENVEIVFARTDMVCEGSFRCSNELLNELFDAAIRTQKNNVLGQTVDCPHREQAQYLADSDLQAETLLYNFDSCAVLEKVLSDFADSQLEDGTFPFVYPSNYESPDFHLQIPEWDMHYCTLMWKLYWISGDLRVLERYYETARKMIDYYLQAVDLNTGLVPLGKGWHISDWPYPTVDHSSEYLTVQNLKLFQAVRIVADAAFRIGRKTEQTKYARLANKLGRSILNHLYDPVKKRFTDCLGSTAAHQGVNGLALYIGLVPESDKGAVADYIAGAEWEARTVLSLPMLRALFENGKQEEAFRIIAREEYPGWGHMIRQGAKTLWEGWGDKESHCHAWNGYPIRLLQEYVTGVRPMSPGFARTSIRPFVPEGLHFAEAAVRTVGGHIHVRWERVAEPKNAEAVRLALEIPAGLTANLNLDGMPFDGDLSVAQAEGTNAVRFVGRNTELGSGHYDFLVTSANSPI